MTAKEAYEKGYRVVVASPFEVGLTREIRGQTQGLRTWWSQDFDGKIPTLDHPIVLQCIENHERMEKEGLV